MVNEVNNIYIDQSILTKTSIQNIKASKRTFANPMKHFNQSSTQKVQK